MRQNLKNIRRCVIKVGSALLTDDGRGLSQSGIQRWVTQIAGLRAQGIEVVLVSSGAVAAGMATLGMEVRPHALNLLQAAAAVGQMGLVQHYESCFKKHGLHAAQVLLTHEDLADRTRYLNARSTLLSLLELGVVPIVNENDTVVTDEIRFGDNDTLGALVANLLEADLLLVLTDQDGLYDKDPRLSPDATLITEAGSLDASLDAMAGESRGDLGRGGMSTKLSAARLAARSGAHTVLANGRTENIINRVIAGDGLGTLLLADQSAVTARKRWLAGHLQMRGELVLDKGAVRVLRQEGKSLLAVGVLLVSGSFLRGEMVRCLDEQGQEIACGLSNYSASETQLIAGVSSSQIEATLGYVAEEELIHRDNLVLV
ncbi:MAG: glutamate 5-kinase [Gammaproteobacteria bacterium]|nr:glutamate 5-kinase [Gammaproteobacteria bacterium]